MKKGRKFIAGLLMVLVLIIQSQVVVLGDAAVAKVSFSTDQMSVSTDQSIIEVGLHLEKSGAYSSAEFGIELSSGLKLKEIRYAADITNKVGVIEKNGVLYFGFFSTENKYSGDKVVATLVIEYGDQLPGQIKLADCKTTTIINQSDVLKETILGTNQINIRRATNETPSNGGTTNSQPTTNGAQSTGGNVIVETTTIEEEALPEALIPVKFTDINNSWAKEYITYLAARGIINGMTQTEFSPKAYVKRGDFTKLLMGVLQEKGQGSINFQDVKTSDYYYQAIMSAQGLDLVKGYNQLFMPQSTITRQDMMTIIWRTLDYKKIKLAKGSDLSQFKDIQLLSDYAFQSVSVLVGNNIINGYNGLLRPKEPVSREEAAKVLYQVFEMINAQ